MWFSISEHLYVTLYSFFMGIGLALLYDVIKLTRIILGISSYSKVAFKLKNLNLPFIKKKQKKNRTHTQSISGFITVFLGDLVYFVLCGAIYSLFLFHAVRGHVRWYFLASSGAGFLLHYFTLSKVNIIILEVLFFIIKCAIMYVCEAVLIPFRLIARIISRIFDYVLNRLFRPVTDNIRYISAIKYTHRIKNNLKDDLLIDGFNNRRKKTE